MRAAQINEYGDKNVMHTVADAQKPTAGPGEVLIEVRAASVNPFDVKVRGGLARQMRELTFPATLGGDFAGTVAELGEGVSGLQVGQAVYGQANALGGQGSFAEFTAAKATSTSPKPTTVDFIQAAALPLAAVSAYQALVDHIGLQRGQKILIHGGAGGIGTIAIQLAKHLGAHVITTATKEDEPYVRELGADEVIDYTTQHFETMLTDLDAVFDTVGGDTYTKSYQVLKQGGMLVSMVGHPDESLNQRYGIEPVAQFTQVTPERLTKVTELVDQGVLKVHIDKVFSLEEAADALGYLETGKHHGKVVIRIQQD